MSTKLFVRGSHIACKICFSNKHLFKSKRCPPQIVSSSILEIRIACCSDHGNIGNAGVDTACCGNCKSAIYTKYPAGYRLDVNATYGGSGYRLDPDHINIIRRRDGTKLLLSATRCRGVSCVATYFFGATLFQITTPLDVARRLDRGCSEPPLERVVALGI